MEKNERKVSLAGIFLVLAIVVIIVMGYYIVTLQNTQKQQKEQVAQLTTQLSQTQTEKGNIQENEYIRNFYESVSSVLGEDNEIYIDLTATDYNQGTGLLTINNKHEVYLSLSNVKEYKSMKKIADNVVNAWYCVEGQAPGDNYIVFLKEDGTVTYARFKAGVFEPDEKKFEGLENISNIIPINGNDENGIGGLGVLFIKTDGTCLPYTTLDDLVK